MGNVEGPGGVNFTRTAVRGIAAAGFILLALLLLGGCWPAPSNGGNDNTVSIQGRITDSLSGDGIPNALVTVAVDGSADSLTVNSDSLGYYSFPRIFVRPQGSSIEWNVYEVGQTSNHVPGNLAFSVTPSTQPVIVNFPMYVTSPLVSLSGLLSINPGASGTAFSARDAAKMSKRLPPNSDGRGTILPGRGYRIKPVSVGVQIDKGKTDRIVVELGRHATDRQAAELAKRYSAKVVDSLPDLGFWVFERAAATGHLTDTGNGSNGLISESIEGLKTSLMLDPAVRSVEESHVVYALGRPNDQFYAEQWNMPLVDMPAAWDYTTGSDNVVVAVIDSGIKAGHEDLAANLLPGWNAITEQPGAEDEGELIGSGPARFSHGTHVAGIIGAIGNNVRGVAGVNWTVRILPIKALQSVNGGPPSGKDTDVAKAIDYAVGHGADVINLSLGFYGENNSPAETPPVLRAAIDRAIASGVVVVAAAGNEGLPYMSAPASYPPVIAVGAVGRDGQRASYSSYGDGISVVAPGGGTANASDMILSPGWLDSASGESQYLYSAGTSMATPHVAGLAALLVAEGVRGQEAVRRIIEETATDEGPPGYDQEYGYGLINARAALEKAVGSGGGSGVDLSKARVFTAYRFQNTLYTRSIEPTDPPVREAMGRYRYRLDSYPGNWTVAAWLDVNQNNMIDTGDYYGEYGSLVRADPYALIPRDDVDITLSRIGGGFSALSVRSVKVVRQETR